MTSFVKTIKSLDNKKTKTIINNLDNILIELFTEKIEISQGFLKHVQKHISLGDKAFGEKATDQGKANVYGIFEFYKEFIVSTKEQLKTIEKSIDIKIQKELLSNLDELSKALLLIPEIN
jgi:hypothetical protein